MFHGVRRSSFAICNFGGGRVYRLDMCEYLLEKGHSVLALDNLMTGSTRI